MTATFHTIAPETVTVELQRSGMVFVSGTARDGQQLELMLVSRQAFELFDKLGSVLMARDLDALNKIMSDL
jgi:hypothetical protein